MSHGEIKCTTIIITTFKDIYLNNADEGRTGTRKNIALRHVERDFVVQR